MKILAKGMIVALVVGLVIGDASFSTAWAQTSTGGSTNKTQYPIKIELTGEVNGEDVAGYARGRLDETTGELLLVYESVKGLEQDVDPRFYSMFIITGYLPASRIMAGGENPFRLKGDHVVNYTRTVTFLDTEDKMVFQARCEKTRDGVKSTFRLDGTVPDGLGTVTGLEPFYEQWSQGPADNVIFGAFPVNWITANNNRVRAFVTSEYKIGENGEKVTPLSKPQQRFITMKLTREGNRFLHQQVSSVASSMAGHESSLRALRSYVPRDLSAYQVR